MEHQTHNTPLVTRLARAVSTPLIATGRLTHEVAAAGPLNEQQAALIEQAARLNGALLLLVDDLLTFEQAYRQSRASRLQVQPDLLVSAVVEAKRAECERRGQQCVVRIQPKLPPVPADAFGLKRAVAALLDNAMQYSSTGAQITLRVGQRNQNLVVAVQDTGVGLSSEELERVFDPFYRAPSTAYLDVAGLGVGLTIAKVIIERHGGRIWATSTPGQGSLFMFYVPFEVGSTVESA